MITKMTGGITAGGSTEMTGIGTPGIIKTGTRLETNAGCMIGATKMTMIIPIEVLDLIMSRGTPVTTSTEEILVTLMKNREENTVPTNTDQQVPVATGVLIVSTAIGDQVPVPLDGVRAVMPAGQIVPVITAALAKISANELRSDPAAQTDQILARETRGK
jgi:hypothetical protein